MRLRFPTKRRVGTPSRPRMRLDFRTNEPSATLSGHSLVVMLVHGFNVSEKSAEASFDRFRENLALKSQRLAQRLVEVHWLGDCRFPLVGSVLYARALSEARDKGKRLAGILEKVRGPYDEPCELVLIGHSMGCRLILEALDELARRLTGDLSNGLRICLMAAAVPVEFVRGGGRLRRGADLAQKRFTYYSPDDYILSSPFRAGQRMARDGNLFRPEAVGLKGNPKQGIWTQRHQMKGFSHGDYWKRWESAHDVARYLGAPAERLFLERELAYRSVSPLRAIVTWGFRTVP